MTDKLADWVAELATAFGIDPAEVDRDLILDVARDAAHGIARPAAPLTTYLVGYAAGRSGGVHAAREAAGIASRLAAGHEPPATETPTDD